MLLTTPGVGRIPDLNASSVVAVAPYLYNKPVGFVADEIAAVDEPPPPPVAFGELTYPVDAEYPPDGNDDVNDEPLTVGAVIGVVGINGIFGKIGIALYALMIALMPETAALTIVVMTPMTPPIMSTTAAATLPINVNAPPNTLPTIGAIVSLIKIPKSLKLSMLSMTAFLTASNVDLNALKIGRPTDFIMLNRVEM